MDLTIVPADGSGEISAWHKVGDEFRLGTQVWRIVAISRRAGSVLEDWYEVTIRLLNASDAGGSTTCANRPPSLSTRALRQGRNYRLGAGHIGVIQRSWPSHDGLPLRVNLSFGPMGGLRSKGWFAAGDDISLGSEIWRVASITELKDDENGDAYEVEVQLVHSSPSKPPVDDAALIHSAVASSADVDEQWRSLMRNMIAELKDRAVLTPDGQSILGSAERVWAGLAPVQNLTPLKQWTWNYLDRARIDGAPDSEPNVYYSMRALVCVLDAPAAGDDLTDVADWFALMINKVQ